MRSAVADAFADRAWHDLWPTMPILAQWWTTQGQAATAAVIIGYLDSHHLTSVDEAIRTRLGTGASIQKAQERGARLDRDQLVAFVLEHVPAAGRDSGSGAK